MELAAVVVVPGTLGVGTADVGAGQESLSLAAITSGAGRAVGSVVRPILGNDVLQTWTERIRKVGVQNIWLASSSGSGKGRSLALAQLLRQGIERLLVIKLKSYAEMDLLDVVRFHRESGSSRTEVLDSQGRLGISVLDQFALCAEDKAAEHEPDGKTNAVFLNVDCTQYPFDGYAKRILSAKERQELVSDALTGACAMRPAGEQIAERIWIGKNVSVAKSAKLSGPSYIGDNTVVRAGATIGSLTSVERDCVVDCGTEVDRSTVLPSTYLGVGLMIRHAMVDGGQLQDLNTGVIVDMQSAGLAGRITPRQSRREASRIDSQIFSPDCNAWIGAQYGGGLQQVRP